MLSVPCAQRIQRRADEIALVSKCPISNTVVRKCVTRCTPLLSLKQRINQKHFLLPDSRLQAAEARAQEEVRHVPCPSPYLPCAAHLSPGDREPHSTRTRAQRAILPTWYNGTSMPRFRYFFTQVQKSSKNAHVLK